MPKQIAGLTLIQILQDLPQTTAIKVVRTGHPTRKMQVSEAILLVKSLAFVAVTNKLGSKIRHIREVQRPQTEWKACWRTTEAAVLLPPVNPRIFEGV